MNNYNNKIIIDYDKIEDLYDKYSNKSNYVCLD